MTRDREARGSGGGLEERTIRSKGAIFRGKGAGDFYKGGTGARHSEGTRGGTGKKMGRGDRKKLLAEA